ncbi:MAG: ABC transporter ATP-binding protein [Candidatus Bathyarchaeia archaeon]
MAKVLVKNLVKKFGNTIAVNNVNLEIKDKEFVVLLGPSGCGKTTTLRCIAGLEIPDEGEIYIEDRLVNDLAPKDRDVAMVFQSYALYPHMTVFDNMAFPLKMRKMPKNEIEKSVTEAAELLMIKHLLNRKPKQLSGGEAQRVALGRAIVRHPKIFLMDEPLSNLDAKLRVYMRAELKRLQKDLAVTTIYVTHDQVEAMTMADRVAIMNRGLLQQLGSPDEIYNSPQNMFVAGFIGSPPMNFFEGTFVEKEGSYLLDLGTFAVPFPQDLGKVVKEKSTGPEVILGVRPEDIILESRVTKKNFPAQVYVIEPLGSEVIVDLKIGDNLIKAKASPSFRADIGETVGMSFNMERAHVFDKKTENAII